MKNIIVVLLLSILFFGCRKVEKNAEDYYPKVKISEAKLLPDGSVEVTGEIISHGTKDITFAGFCMDTIPNVSMMRNQQKVKNLSGNKFSTIYKGLNMAHTYYFKSWATNPYGYDMSDEVLSMDSVTINAGLVPCILPMDSLILTVNGSERKERISVIEDINDRWKLELYSYTSGTTITMEFSKKPVSGVYKTSANTALGEQTVQILVDRYLVENSADVYVREISTKEIEVSICRAVTSNGKIFATKFRAKYEK